MTIFAGVLLFVILVLVVSLIISRAQNEMLRCEVRAAQNQQSTDFVKDTQQSIDSLNDSMRKAREAEAERHRNRMIELREQRPNAAMEAGLVRFIHYNAKTRTFTVEVPNTERADLTIADMVGQRHERMMWVSQS